DLHDVVVSGDRPIRPEDTVLAVMDRFLAAQPVEIGPVRIGLKQFGIAGVELFQRKRQGTLFCALLAKIVGELDGPMHGSAPSIRLVVGFQYAYPGLDPAARARARREFDAFWRCGK